MANYKIVALLGYYGAGKKTLIDYVVSHSHKYNKIIKDTTLPPSVINWENSFFNYKTIEDFTTDLLEGNIIEAIPKDGDFEGLNKNSLVEDKINIGIFNPEEVQYLLEYKNLQVFPVFIAAGSKERLLRKLNQREFPDCIDICEQFLKDKEIYCGDDDFDFKVYNNTHDEYELFLLTLNDWVKKTW